MRPKDYKHLKDPTLPGLKFPKHKNWVNHRGSYATPVGDKTILKWISGSVSRKTIISHYIWLKYKFEVSENRRRRWIEEVKELRQRVAELEKVESAIEQKLRTKLVFGELPTPISNEINKLMIKAYIDGKVKI